MPMYPARCVKCGHTEDFYATIDDRNNVPKHCKKPMQRLITKAFVMEDMKPYVSPLDGKVVSSRKEHREKMEKHGVIEIGNEKIKPRKRPEPEGIKQDVYDAFKQHGAL